MTREEALVIVKACENWNTGQKSISLAFGGPRTAEDDVYDARRAALKQAWQVLGGSDA
jgi:hypothetical protein